MDTKPSAAVAAAIASSQTTANPDKLAKLREAAREARDLEFRIADLQNVLKERKAELDQIYSQKLPQLLDELGLDQIGIPAEQNMPGYDYKLKPYYSANIAASWPTEKREAAFDYVKSMGAEDLIKTEVVAYFPKGGLKQAQKLLSQIKKIKIATKVGKKKITKPIQVELSKSIPHASLTAWLRELIEKHHSMPDLEKIGGSVGRMVKPEERK